MDNRFAFIGRNIMAVEKNFKLYFKTALKKHGFSTAEGFVLYAFYVQPGDENCGKTAEQLCSLLHLDKAEMSRSTKSLENKGCIIRVSHISDSRSHVLKLADKGLAFQPVLSKILDEWNEDVLSAVDPQTLMLISTAVAKMLVNARKKVKTTNAQEKLYAR